MLVSAVSVMSAIVAAFWLRLAPGSAPRWLLILIFAGPAVFAINLLAGHRRGGRGGRHRGDLSSGRGAASRPAPVGTTAEAQGGRDQSGRLARAGLAFMAFAMFVVMPAVGTVLLVLHLPPAIAAAHGHGTRGTFIARHKVCDRYGCTWTGDFVSDDGRIKLHHVDGGRLAHAAGDRRRVIEGGGDIFLPGSKSWIGVLLVGLLGWASGGVGIVLLWRNRREIVRRITRRAGKAPHSS